MNVYLFQAALLCEDCGHEVCKNLTEAGEKPFTVSDESSYDSDDYPKGPYPDGGGEADSPQHCDHCNVFLENPLTADGVAYVSDALQNPEKFPITAQEWLNFYGADLPKREPEPKPSGFFLMKNRIGEFVLFQRFDDGRFDSMILKISREQALEIVATLQAKIVSPMMAIREGFFDGAADE